MPKKATKLDRTGLLNSRDNAYVDNDAEKERESWTDLDDEVSAVDIIVPRLLICSSLLDCSG